MTIHWWIPYARKKIHEKAEELLIFFLFECPYGRCVLVIRLCPDAYNKNFTCAAPVFKWAIVCGWKLVSCPLGTLALPPSPPLGNCSQFSWIRYFLKFYFHLFVICGHYLCLQTKNHEAFSQPKGRGVDGGADLLQNGEGVAGHHSRGRPWPRRDEETWVALT